MTLSIQLIQIPEAETVPKREFYLDGSKVDIGRDFAADICLPDMSEQMSRRHIQLMRLPDGGYTVIDLSTNGAKLNGKDLPSGEAHGLNDGDVIGILGYRLLVSLIARSGKVVETADDLMAGDPFETTTDFSAKEPLIANAEIEAYDNEPKRGFSDTVKDLDEDLMFDPFAEGPELREPVEPKRHFQQTPMSETETAENVEVMRLPHTLPSTTQIDALLRGQHYQENALEAVERALERFLDEVDPNILEDDYKLFIPPLMRRKKRFWAIHRRQFAKKKASGEFKRSFLALFAEEMRKQ